MKTHTQPCQDSDLMPADIIGGVIAALFYIVLIVAGGFAFAVWSSLKHLKRIHPEGWLYLACVAFIVPCLIHLIIHLTLWKP